MRTLLSLALVISCMNVAGAADLPELQTYTRTLGPYQLHAEVLGQMPAGHEEISFPDAVWVLFYRSEILNEQGEKLQDNYHCHTMLQKFLSYSKAYRTLDGRPFKGLFTDGYNTELRVPDGFGVYYDANEPIRWTPMFNNRDPQPFQASMRITLKYVYAKDLKEPLKPLYGTILSVANPHGYLVKPGVDVRDREFQFPYAGKIHVMGTHIHPYGKKVEFLNDSRGETIWEAAGQRSEQGILLSMPQYRNMSGYQFQAGETYRLRVTYDNPTDREQDAMGGLFFLFSTPDGKPPLRPDESVDAEEPEDHIHH